ncbi:MAG: DUF1232 domain-containing protein [Ardenticatenales bacterium]|nr:DUF1232 domain-containing protein [Ardenticatenales bacterium]
MKKLAARWKATITHLKSETLVLYLAYQDARTPWAARFFVALVVGYALSPIDLIPDFIPLLGLLDDALLLPLGLWVALRLIPEEVIRDARAEAALRMAEGRPVSRLGAVLVLALWILGIVLAGGWLAEQLTVQ